LLLVGFVLLGSLDATHHWFSTLAAMAAVMVLLEGVTFRRIGVAGAFCGLAACFTQTVSATFIVGIIAYLAWKTQREGASNRELGSKCLLLCGTAAVLFVAVNGYFVWAAGLRQWLFRLVVYPVRYFTVPAINNWRIVRYDFEWHPGSADGLHFPSCTLRFLSRTSPSP
jgi:hypothetical protein